MNDKVLLFLTTDHHEADLQTLLSRLPSSVINHPDCHILILQNQAKYLLDTGSFPAPYQNVTLIRSSMPLTYGAIQKVGCRYAVQNHFQLFISIQKTLDQEGFDQILGAWKLQKSSIILSGTLNDAREDRRFKRMLYRFFARQMGKIIGEEKVQDYLLDFTRAYRGYDVRFLGQVPFELNTEDPWYDIEIMFQAHALGVKIAELPAVLIAEKDSSRHFNIRYAWNVLAECFRFRSQKVGFFCSMRYRGLLHQETKYTDKSESQGSTHAYVIEHVPTTSRVIDLGCGPGYVSKKLHERGCYVVGVDEVAPDHFSGDRFIAMDLESGPVPEDLSSYDYILLLDVLEHMVDPERFLINIRYSCNTEKRPRVIFSTGNVAFLGVRLALGVGLFNYGERGILDVTHKRLFTLGSFYRVLRETGYEIENVHGIGVPFTLLFPNRIGRWLSQLSQGMARFWPSLWAYQILIEARPQYHSLMVLSNSEGRAPEGVIAKRSAGLN